MNITIRIAKPVDTLLITDIGKKTFYETWRPVNTEEDMQNYLKEAFDLKKIEDEIKLSNINTFLIAENDKQIIGYAKLRRDRTYDEFKNEKALEIERVYVLKEWQDKKIGKLLMDESIKIAKSENHKWLWLGVNIDNHKAINFYKKYDFEIFGEKSFRLGEAEDTDYLMKSLVVSL